MTPETEKLIAEFPELSEEAAKLIFIRQSAQEAYCNDTMKEATGNILKEIVEISTVSNMTKEDVALHIGKLEEARSYLAAFTQGIMSGHADDIEPKIKAKRAKEAREKGNKKKSSSQDRVNALIEMAMAASMKDGEDSNKEPEIVLTSPKKIAKKEACPKCHKEVYVLKFHKC